MFDEIGAHPVDGLDALRRQALAPAACEHAAAAQQQPNPWMSILPFVAIFAVMIFFMNRSQKTQMATRQEMMD